MTAPSSPIWTDAAAKSSPSVRPIEVAAAITLIILAIVLRWAPSRTRGTSALQEAAISSAEWVTTARRLTLRQLLGAVFTGCAIGLFIGGPGGLFCGLMGTVGALALGSRRASERESRSRLRLVAAAPPVVDLFAAGLTAGLLPADAAAASATAYSTPDHNTPTHDPLAPDTPPRGTLARGALAHDDLERIDADPSTPRSDHFERFKRFRPRRLTPRTPRTIDPAHEIAQRFAHSAQALRRGIDPEAAWRPLAVDVATAPVAAAALRASRTGAPAAETVTKAARDLWNAADQAAQAQLRAATARSAMPLALCFLPAFVLIGIVPTVIGILAELRL